jgi:hypothetical protein
MGTDTEVFVFDHDAYLSDVVPVFHELLLNGQAPGWLYQLSRTRDIRFESWDRTDLLRYCTYLGKDFSWIWDDTGKDIWQLEWDHRACLSEDCPERGHCPFHQSNSPARAEELLWLFKAAVSIKCLGPSQFVGRSRTVFHYSQPLIDLGVNQDDPLRNLLSLLGNRGFVVGYQWGFGFEGINGWLSSNETLELAQRLDELALPKYEVSLEAMMKFQSPHPIPQLYEQFGVTAYDCPGYSFEALSLSFVRTMATIATTKKRGILWGNGVMPSEFYLRKRDERAGV